jgi:hypothetical protein
MEMSLLLFETGLPVAMTVADEDLPMRSAAVTRRFTT